MGLRTADVPLGELVNRIAAKLVIAALLLAFVLINAWAYSTTPITTASDLLAGPLRALADVIPSNRWVTVIASDLILGWALAAIGIWHLESRRWSALMWIVGVFCIGNLVTSVYLLVRYDRIVALTAGLRRGATTSTTGVTEPPVVSQDTS